MKKIFLGMMAITMALSFTACQDGLDNIILDGVGGLGQSCRDGAPLCDGDLVCTGGVCLDESIPPPPLEPEKFKALSRLDYYTLTESKDIWHGVIEIAYDDEGRLTAAKESLGKKDDEKLSLVGQIKFAYDSENRPQYVSHFDKDNNLKKKVKIIYSKEGTIEAKEEIDADRVVDKITYTREFAQASEKEMVKKLTAVFDSDTTSFLEKIINVRGAFADNGLSPILIQPPKTPDSVYLNWIQPPQEDQYPTISIFPGGIKIPEVAPLIPGITKDMKRIEFVEFNALGLPVKFLDGLTLYGHPLSRTIEFTYDDKSRLTEVKTIGAAKTEVALSLDYSSAGLPINVSENNNAKKFNVIPTFQDGILIKEDIKENGNEGNSEQRLFQYIELEKEPIMPPIAWIQSIMDHSSTLYVDIPEKLFGKWTFISVR